MRHFVCGLAVVLACGVARADEGEDAAAKWAESVEGRVVRDAKAAGKPVVEVAFGPVNKKVTDDGLKELAGLKNLKSLTIFFCDQIGDAGMKHVKGLTTLETLGLGNTSVTDDGLAELKDLKKLKSLTVSGCIRMTDKSAETIKTFADLEYLSLPSTITPKGVKDLAGLKKLKSLYIGGATLSDEAVKDIADNMPQLEGLNLGTLAGNGLTDESVPHLARLKKLKTLSIIGAKLTDTGLKSLQKALPDCTITTR
jgi:internalin A